MASTFACVFFNHWQSQFEMRLRIWYWSYQNQNRTHLSSRNISLLNINKYQVITPKWMEKFSKPPELRTFWCIKNLYPDQSHKTFELKRYLYVCAPHCAVCDVPRWVRSSVKFSPLNSNTLSKLRWKLKCSHQSIQWISSANLLLKIYRSL